MTVIRNFLLFLTVTHCRGLRDIDSATRSAMGALQRDMKMVGDITICTGLKRYIACTEGSNLAITKAFWGRISDKVCPSDDGDPVTDCDGSEDTLPLVKGYCDGKRECKLEARHTLLQKNGTHHCPGVNKYLVVNYTCIPESKGVTLCDSAETTLMCEAGWVIEIADIFWGRRSHAKYCGAEEGMECDSSETAAKYVRNQCDGKRKCPVKAEASLLDSIHSPCSSILKYLMINYVCKPPEKDTLAKEMSGLLESRYPVTAGVTAEIKAPQPVQAIAALDQMQIDKDTRGNQREATEEKKYTPIAVQTLTYTPRKAPKKTYFAAPPSNLNAEENEELSNALGTPGDVTTEHSIKKQEVPDYDKIAKEETVKEKKHHSPRLQRKDEMSKKFKEKEEVTIIKDSDEDETAGSKRDDDEVIVHEKLVSKKDKHESHASKSDRDERVGTRRDEEDAGDSEEKFYPKLRSESDLSYKISEPASVRSILARAKEVLQTLDSDTDSATARLAPVVEKRENIASKGNSSSEVDNPGIDMAAVVRNIVENAKSLVEESTPKADATNVAPKSDATVVAPKENLTTVAPKSDATTVAKNFIQETSEIKRKPKPGIKKSAIVPSSGSGFGNTP